MTYPHKPSRWCAALAACCIGLLFVGCASTPDPQLLSLPLPAEQAGTPDAQTGQATSMLVLRRVNIPEYMQTPRVRYRADNSVLANWPHVVWAERLESSLTDHLLIRLRARLPGWTVCERACPASKAAYVLAMDLSPLDQVRAPGELRTQAHWQITWRGDSSGASHDGMRTLALPTPSDSAQGQAEAMARMLDVLAQDIARQITQQRDQDETQAGHKQLPPPVETKP
jgi:uncharacterized lipoprotein YmbA